MSLLNEMAAEMPPVSAASNLPAEMPFLGLWQNQSKTSGGFYLKGQGFGFCDIAFYPNERKGEVKEGSGKPPDWICYVSEQFRQGVHSAENRPDSIRFGMGLWENVGNDGKVYSLTGYLVQGVIRVEFRRNPQKTNDNNLPHWLGKLIMVPKKVNGETTVSTVTSTAVQTSVEQIKPNVIPTPITNTSAPSTEADVAPFNTNSSENADELPAFLKNKESEDTSVEERESILEAPEI